MTTGFWSDTVSLLNVGNVSPLRPTTSVTDNKRTALPTYFMDVSCSICGATDIKLVRDHDHTTGTIRGTLCERCNSWLGLYEYNKRQDTQHGRKRYKRWATVFKEAIEMHLQRDTGVRYGGKPNRAKSLGTEMGSDTTKR